MFRIHLARLAVLITTLSLVGCSSFRSNSCSTCERPGLFSRFRTASSTKPVVVSQGDCCDRVVSGPYMPATMGAPTTILPAPSPAPSIPRIDENGKEMPWDPNKKMNRPIMSGTKTGNDIRATKEGS